MDVLPVFVSRGSDGLNVYEGIDEPFLIFPKQSSQESTKKECRCYLFSPDGKYFAFCDSEKTTVVETTTWSTILSEDLPKTSALHFSPNSNFFSTWQVFTTSVNPDKIAEQQQHNLRVYDLRSNPCAIVCKFIEKRQQSWKLQWTHDEEVCARLVGSELLFHEKNEFSKYCQKLVIQKMTEFSLSPCQKPYHVAAYVPVGKDTPAVVKLFAYPDFQAPVAAKTFFKADRISMKWNKRGNALIIMAIIDVDSTGQSYYGEQNLYFVSTKGDSYMVPLGKNGPVYHVEWNPNSLEYCVVYGYMPAKATLYNLKGDILFDFGTGPRNEAHYDPFGKILCLCGFGNLKGNMEFWSVADKKRVSQFVAEDTTLFHWCPDGQHILTATTSPRLRVNNGFKLWRYSGELVNKKDLPELWEVSFCPNFNFIEKPIVLNAHPSVQSKGDVHSSLITAAGVNKAGAYVPPHMRGVQNKPTFKLHEDELPSNEKQKQLDESNMSKQALKNKKRQEAKKAKAEDNIGGNKNSPQPASVGQQSSRSAEIPISTGDADKDKKIKNLNKKLEQIAALKSKLEGGEKLELNQLEKLKKEDEIRGELEALRLS